MNIMPKQEEKEKEVESEPKPIMRQIIIETDGNQITVKEAAVAGKLEFIAILESVINFLKNK